MFTFDAKSIVKKESIDVRFFAENVVDQFKISLLTSESGFDKKIKSQNLHRPGLALAGFVELFAYTRIQIFGNTEMSYLAKLSGENRFAAVERIFQFDVPCIIFTNNHKPFPEMLDLAEEYSIPMFSSPYSTTKLTYLVSDFLDDQFAPRLPIHGSFMDVYGIGILFVGKSGVGKSEVALDLVERGHRLVADDVTILTKKGEGILIGSGTDLTKHFMEIRGLGLINIAKMFGVRAVRYQKRLEVIVELAIYSPDEEYTRTGLDETSVSIFDVEIPYIKLPIVPGKNLTVISEVIALNYLLKHYGYDAAKIFQDKLETKLKNQANGKDNNQFERGIEYFEHDFE